LKHLWIYILFLFISAAVFSQQDSLVVKYDTKNLVEKREFSSKNLDTYRDSSDFNYTEVKQEDGFFGMIWSWVKRILTKVLSWFFGVEPAVGIMLTLIKILPYIILFIVLILILKFFLKINSRNIISGKNDKAKVIITQDEEIILNKNIEELIEKAIAQKNYRLAIRYYYLLVLQKLQEKEFIIWEQQKTNEDYIKEIKENNITSKFRNVTNLYDFVWYGNFEINEIEFSKAADSFVNLTTSIK